MVFTFTAMVISPVTFYNGAFFKSFRKNFRFF
ncbi:Uncharacterised protein [Vibrio cholerae]|nr:Uncharacterised protein [Vibrio cholerae]